ncbi:MAG: hypothetical protein J6V44_12045 [Methanobrevibacter sp.]|nr:hypothetical protein [Methanobrevibacter sp.]
MKIREVLDTHGYISELKLNKFDKEIRIKLMRNYPVLDKVVKEVNDYKSALQEKMFEEHKADGEKVQELRRKLPKVATEEELDALNKEAAQYSEYLRLEQEFIKCLTEHMEEEVEVKLFPIDKEDFVDNLVKADIEFTLDLLNKIDILFR